MKTIFKLTVAFMVVLALSIASCTTNDAAVNGSTYISYVRKTNPISSDSLIATAGQGQMLALIGDNLENTVEVWFNDQKSRLQATLVSKKSIITTVPSTIPGVVTNKIKLVKSDGSVYTYDFKVKISEPSIKGMLCEYVTAGKTAVIQGDYFYEPLTVTFTGGAVGTISSIVDFRTLNVTIPAGAQPGPVTITSNFGTTISDFYFRDNRNIFVSSDPFKGYSGAGYVVTAPGATDPEAINGNYIRVKKPIGAWEWTPFVEGSANDFGALAKAIPDDAILHPADYNFKFELNTYKPFDKNIIKFQIGMSGNILDNKFAYIWQPPYDTKGQWETVTISFDKLVSLITPVVNSNGYSVRMLYHGDGSLDCDMSFDNFRVVKKELKLNK